jgi:hypothetical protein
MCVFGVSFADVKILSFPADDLPRHDSTVAVMIVLEFLLH